MKGKNYRDFSKEDLRKELIELSRALFSARIRYASNQFQNTSEFHKIRRDIARVKTIMTQQERM